MQKQSNYKVIKWEEERLENERLIENISEYPIKLYDGYRDHSRLPTAEIGIRKKENLPNIRNSGGSVTRKSKRRRKINTQQDFYRNRDTLTAPYKTAQTPSQRMSKGIEQDIGGLIGLDSNRKILAKEARMMSNGFYFIEISHTDEIFYIAAIKKRNANENYLIELEWEKSKEILLQFRISGEEGIEQEQNYDRLIQSLEILENRLVLLNPKVNPQKIIKKRRTKTRGSQSQQRMRMRKKGTPYQNRVESHKETEKKVTNELLIEDRNDMSQQSEENKEQVEEQSSPRIKDEANVDTLERKDEDNQKATEKVIVKFIIIIFLVFL